MNYPENVLQDLQIDLGESFMLHRIWEQYIGIVLSYDEVKFIHDYYRDNKGFVFVDSEDDVRKIEEKKNKVIQKIMASLTEDHHPLTEIPGLKARAISNLNRAGINSVERLKKLSLKQMSKIPGIGKSSILIIEQYFENSYSRED